MGMNTLATGIQAAENDLKQLMAEVSRAMEKAQEAVAKMACNTAAAAAETESTTSPR
jgi:glutamate racemase